MIFRHTLLTLILSLQLFLVASCEESPKYNVSKKSYQFTGNSLNSPIENTWIRSNHPRVLLDSERLSMVINRMYGKNAREPYSRWFNLIKTTEDNGKPVDLVNLALIYKATLDDVYKDKFLKRLPSEGVPGLVELYAIDIMYDELEDSVKHAVMSRVASSTRPWYYGSIEQSNGTDQTNWGYHDARKVAPAFAYSAIFANTIFETNKDKSKFPFNANNYLNVVQHELSEDGNFWKIENRIAGETKYNNALDGSKGGMYDNIGYDAAEESYSIILHLQNYVLTGNERYKGALHDKYRADFYQNLYVPHTAQAYTRRQYCRKADTKSYTMAQIWDTQTSGVKQPALNTVAVTAFLYQDPKMQYFFNNGVQREFCSKPYNGMFWDLIYYDDTLEESPPSNNETATYYNGPGIVSMRSDWSDNAAFALFLSGEGISRRYEDANSFIISKKTDVISHAGARIRFNENNLKHTWYHMRSASTNTLKIFDPDESFDINADGTIGELNTGTPLVASDNLGGQIFERPASNQDLCFNLDNLCSTKESRNTNDFPLGVIETSNIIKFEHSPEEFTYTVGDASKAYTKKVEYFEREFLFLRPDIFVIFDRVKSTNPTFKKVWAIHTIDEPRVNTSDLFEKEQGMNSYLNANAIEINHPLNNTYIDSLLPENNKVVIRGGDTILASTNTFSELPIIELDHPHWLEIFIQGSDLTGSVTITGDTSTQSNDSEVIIFDGKVQTYMSSNADVISNNALTDSNTDWKVDQWKGYQVSYYVNSEKVTTVISSNDNNTLYGNFKQTNYKYYNIERPFSNSYKEWKKINSISPTNLNVDNVTISIPHYFDTEDIKGRVHSFSPNTDYRHDRYQKRKSIGQWTLEVEATVPKKLDNFLNIVSLKPPQKHKPVTHLITSEKLSGAFIDNTFVLFANEKIELKSFNVILERAVKSGIIANLIPQHPYYYRLNLNIKNELILTVSEDDNGGIKQSTSKMGLLELKNLEPVQEECKLKNPYCLKK